MLSRLDDDAWQTPTLCSEWSVSQVVAHLTAAANTGRFSWLRSIVLAGFNPALHNERRLRRYLGETPALTLASLRASAEKTVAPTKDYAAMLGEVIVHGQDISRPLGLELVPEPAAVHEVARFFSERDFAVNSKRLVTGLRLEAEDSSFSVGSGPLVSGKQLDLVMIMAGRPAYMESLRGDGVEVLAQRLA
ncbi:maleylpyruvate isomerase family mycothiol-dependent enzyme [Glutamicibacter arilaitensis]|uniref:maleylpyruvate isomerase family mycothiol-dependent enzyme n=1 Tax=Glutamicibacter arilaitensis TaxID=256701 RepID=UPI00384AAC52